MRSIANKGKIGLLPITNTVMIVNLSSENVKIGQRIKNRVQTKFGALEKYLRHFNDEFKTASINIRKNRKLGYQFKFDMGLPGLHIHSENQHHSLITGILRLRDTVKKQLSKGVDKLKE